MDDPIKEDQKRPEQPKWLNGLLALICLSAVGVLIYFSPCPTTTEYIYFKVLIAFGAAAASTFLLGYITFSYSHKNSTIKAGGGIAIFLLMFRFTPELPISKDRCTQSTTIIMLRDSAGLIIPGLNGNLMITSNGLALNYPIGPDGSVYVQNSGSAEKLPIELNSTRWVFQETHTKFLEARVEGTAATIKLSPDEKYCCLFGKVVDSSGEGLPAAKVTVLDHDTLSDLNGKFRFYIPPGLRGNPVFMQVSKSGYDVYQNEFSVYLNGEVLIYLPKRKSK